MLILTITNNILNARIVDKKFPQLRCKGKITSEDKKEIKKQVSGLMVSKICFMTRNSFDSIFVSAFISLTMTRTTYTSAAGLWWENRSRAICETVANIILNYLLVQLWGVYGIVLATIIPLVLINFGFGAQVLFKHYFTEEKISRYFIDNLSYAVVTIISAIW